MIHGLSCDPQAVSAVVTLAMYPSLDTSFTNVDVSQSDRFAVATATRFMIPL